MAVLSALQSAPVYRLVKTWSVSVLANITWTVLSQISQLLSVQIQVLSSISLAIQYFGFTSLNWFFLQMLVLLVVRGLLARVKRLYSENERFLAI